MNRPNGTPGSQIDSDLAKGIREQALQIINASLEEARTQHPLDVPRIFNHDRPTLGSTVPLQLYRAVRLLAFREVLGSKVSAAILSVSGRSVAQKMRIRNVQELIRVLENLSVGKLTSLEQSDDQVVFAATECATCSGLPNIGEPLCYFEAGFIAGGLEEVLGKHVKVIETRCWGLGDKVCRWEARRDSRPGRVDDGSEVDTLELVMTLAGKAALTVENSVAIRRKNRELRQAYHQLRESERLKKDLCDMVVHDMRVPLTAVMGSLETLAELTESKVSPRESKLLVMALSSGHMLVQMIDDLLDVSKLEEEKVTLRKSRVSVSELVEQAIKQMGVIAGRKKLNVDTELAPGLPDLSVDRHRMVRVLVNLLWNAVQHTPSGGTISVCALCEPDGKKVRFSVSDTGKGIPQEYHRKIFDKFVQLDPHEAKKRRSIGLGLTFCKLVTEAHSGSIWVESKPGTGSTFAFTLPVESE